MIIVKVKVFGLDKTYQQEFCETKTITLSKDDPILSQMVNNTVEKFPGDIEEVKVTIKMEW